MLAVELCQCAGPHW